MSWWWAAVEANTTRQRTETDTEIMSSYECVCGWPQTDFLPAIILNTHFLRLYSSLADRGWIYLPHILANNSGFTLLVGRGETRQAREMHGSLNPSTININRFDTVLASQKLFLKETSSRWLSFHGLR